MMRDRSASLGPIYLAAALLGAAALGGCGSSVTIDGPHGAGGDTAVGTGAGSSSSSGSGASSSSSGAPACQTGSALAVIAPEEHGASFVAADATHAYWSTDTAIRRAPIAGGGPVETVAGDQPNPMGLALDQSHVYWVNHDDERLLRAPKAGGAPEVLADGTGNGGAFGNVVLDDSYAYLRGGCGALLRVPKGGGAAVMVAPAQSCVQSLVLADDWLYFGDDGALRKVLASGGTPITLVSAEVGGVGGWTGGSVGMAVGGGNVYWMSAELSGGNGTGGRLMRVSTSGGEPEVLAAHLAYGEDVVFGAQAVYFAEQQRIAKLHLVDGSIETVAESPQYRPIGIALSGDALVFTNYLTTAAVLGVCR